MARPSEYGNQRLLAKLLDHAAWRATEELMAALNEDAAAQMEADEDDNEERKHRNWRGAGWEWLDDE